jgi:hypothetical protein
VNVARPLPPAIRSGASALLKAFVGALLLSCVALAKQDAAPEENARLLEFPLLSEAKSAARRIGNSYVYPVHRFDNSKQYCSVENNAVVCYWRLAHQ